MGPIEQRLFEEFKDRGKLRSNTLLLRQEGAIDYVHRCFEYQAPILGIDSFELIGDSIRTEDYIDYSSSSFHLTAPDVWKEAEDFLRNHPQSDLWFEVVIDEPSAPGNGSKA
ncbi:MAG: hypothetical protein ACRD3N_15045 [Terracidiphilus sp.]